MILEGETLRRVKLSIEYGKLDVKYAPPVEHETTRYGHVIVDGVSLVVSRAIVTRRDGRRDVLDPIFSRMDAMLANAQESAGGGSGLGGYAWFLDMAVAMTKIAPESTHAAWFGVIAKFRAADAVRA